MSKGYTAQSLKQTLYKLGKGYSKIAQAVAQQRYILTLNGVNSYIDTGGYTYSGDFWIEVTAQLPAVLPASNQAFFGGRGGGSPNAGAFTLFLNPAQNTISTQIPTSVGGTRYDLGVSATSYLGKAVKFRVERVSGIWTLQIDDVLVDTYDSNPHGVVDMEVTSIGRWSTTLYYSGALYNYKDSLGNSLPINDRTFGVGAVIANSATVLGVELIDCTAATGRVASLSNVTNNSMTITNTITSYGTSEQVVNLEAGTYLLEFDTVNLNPSTNSSGFVTFTPSEWADRVATYTSVEGLNKTLITIPQSGTHNVWFHVGGSVQGDSRRYSNITLRKADGYATGVNLLESGWEEIPL